MSCKNKSRLIIPSNPWRLGLVLNLSNLNLMQDLLLLNLWLHLPNNDRRKKMTQFCPLSKVKITNFPPFNLMLKFGVMSDKGLQNRFTSISLAI